jgi:hypothetical protein
MRFTNLALGSMALLAATWASPESASSRVSVRIPAVSQIAIMTAASHPAPLQVGAVDPARALRSAGYTGASPLTVEGQLGADDTIALTSLRAFQVAARATCPRGSLGCGTAHLSITETRKASAGQGMPRGLESSDLGGAGGSVRLASLTGSPVTLGFGLLACTITASASHEPVSGPIEIEVTTTPVL